MTAGKLLQNKYLIALLCLPLTLAVFGFTFYFSSNAQQVIPFAFKLANPALFPADSYMDSLKSFPSLWPWIMSHFAGMERLDILHFILYIFTRYFFFVCVWLLAKEMFRHKSIAALACFLAALAPFCNIITPLGKDPMLKAEMYQTALTAPFILFSIWLFLRKKFYPSFIILALMYYLNGLLVNYAIAFLAFAFFAVKDKKTYLKALIIPALIMIPWAYMYFTRPDPFAPPAPQFIEILRFWYNEHYFILKRSPDFYIAACSLIPLFMLLVWRETKSTKHTKIFKAFLAACVFLWGTAFIFADIIPVPQITVVQLLRSDSILAVFAAICMAPFVLRLFKQAKLKTHALAFLFITCALTVFHTFLVFFALFIYISERFFKGRYTLITVLCAFVYTAAMLILMPFSFSPVLAIAVLSAVYLAADKCFTSFWLKRQKLAAAFLILIFSLQYSEIAVYRWQVLKGESLDQRGNWISFCKWIEKNTPPDAVFIKPSGGHYGSFDGFRLAAKRTPAFEWLDNAACHWAMGYEKIWIRKLKILSSRITVEKDESTLEGYKRLKEDDFIYFSKAFNAGYVITQKEHELKFPLLYSDKGFNLYRIEEDKTIRP